MEPEFVLACLSVLSSHNLVTALAIYRAGARYKITDSGRALVKVMSQGAG